MMSVIPQRPQLRAGIQAGPGPDPDHIVLYDSRRLVPGSVVISRSILPLIRHFNGQHTLNDLSQAIGGTPAHQQALQQLVEGLDEALFLDSQRFVDYVNSPNRHPTCIGVYSENPEQLRQQLAELFTAPGGPGLPDPHMRGQQLRAVLVPHMDYRRGGITYGFGYKELVEQSAAKLFIIIATSHYSTARISITRKNYSSPLGVVPTDQQAVSIIEKHCGQIIYTDPYAHLPEHSIELEVVLLQFLLADRPFRIVPVLIGGFHDFIYQHRTPEHDELLQSLNRALRDIEHAAGEEVCYLISGDLAHIGPKFGHAEKVNTAWLDRSALADRRILESLETVDHQQFFQLIAAERDERNICGLPPTWVALQAARPRSGKLLHYGRSVDPNGHESVSFAAVAFYR